MGNAGQDSEVLIIGAGVAGLAAAEKLARSGCPVRILEARERLGGRIWTIYDSAPGLPIELGAEFIHGGRVPTWEVIRCGGLPTHEVPDRTWRFDGSRLQEEDTLWDGLEDLGGRMEKAPGDQDLRSFLERSANLSETSRKLVLRYVEGFHAANPERMGIRAFSLAESAAEQEEGDRQFRITPGYGALLHWYGERLQGLGVKVEFGARARRIEWQPRLVTADCETSSGSRRFGAAQMIVTLPLGVLKSGDVRFTPELTSQDDALRSLEMGVVLKFVFEFREQFWPVENFGFIQAENERIPTWWSDQRGLVLTGWVGGPPAERLSAEPVAVLQTIALRSLSNIFSLPVRKLESLMLKFNTHNWATDPFSRGAYAYTPVNMVDMPKRLASPVEGTLFFAGEATDWQGNQGTVHGALASGWRAASEVLRGG